MAEQGKWENKENISESRTQKKVKSKGILDNQYSSIWSIQRKNFKKFLEPKKVHFYF